MYGRTKSPKLQEYTDPDEKCHLRGKDYDSSRPSSLHLTVPNILFSSLGLDLNFQ